MCWLSESFKNTFFSHVVLFDEIITSFRGLTDCMEIIMLTTRMYEGKVSTYDFIMRGPGKARESAFFLSVCRKRKKFKLSGSGDQVQYTLSPFGTSASSTRQLQLNSFFTPYILDCYVISEERT